MAWDASTDASVAALLVACVALIVTSAQAVQQYLISGQLIRICDSVVFGKMPGQGRRIWEFSQFRFRVVYSIPQIRLPISLWSDIPSHTLWDQEGDLTLPDLQISKVQNELGLKQAIKKQFDLQMGRTRDLICGEASWVSFGRAIQHSSGNSLRYDMVDGDADRCPTDLPIVPMQLCMRDVIAVATMAGLECTDVSYQQQSISMQGSAGTITSSRHPILGALIHFAPKLPHERHGIRTNDGTVNPQWVARMRDIITVAGQQYSMRDRKHFEEDEGHWVMLSDDRSLVKYEEKNFRKPASVNSELRRRRGIQGPQSEDLISTDQIEHSTMEVVAHNSNDPKDLSIRRPQDGEWSWSFSSERTEAEKASASHEAGYLPLSSSTQAQVFSSRNWHYQLTSFFRRRFSATTDLPHFIRKPSVLPVSEPIGNSRQKIQPSTDTNNSTFFATLPTRMKGNHPKSNHDGVRGEAFKNHVEPNLRVSKDEIHDDSQPSPRRLLLTNKEDTKSPVSSVKLHDDWYTEQEKELAAAQAKQIGRKWQNIVKKRQELRAGRSRKEQDWLRRTDTRKGIPSMARWTKIDRRLVSPKALEEAHERFEKRLDFVIVLRVLTREEIEEYALRTQQIRRK